jgi:hypothetical protein
MLFSRSATKMRCLVSPPPETVDGNCVRCDGRTRHAIRPDRERAEYFECLTCGNKVDAKAFVFFNLDALDGGPRGQSDKVRVKRRKRR